MAKVKFLINEAKRKKKKNDGYLPGTFLNHKSEKIGNGMWVLPDPVAGIDFFNKRQGTDFPTESEKVIPTEATPAESTLDGGASGTTDSGASGEAGSGEGGMGEGLKKIKTKIDKLKEELVLAESERKVKRYYIRPQNIFAGNKGEILDALAKIGDNDCSVYSLKSLDDHDDVHLLKPSDIIYYYDDGVLYDKNHVKVMDYNLFVKNEEERKHFGNVEAVSDAVFDKEYADRLHEGLSVDNPYAAKAIEMFKDDPTAEGVFVSIKVAGVPDEIEYCKTYHDEDELDAINADINDRYKDWVSISALHNRNQIKDFEDQLIAAGKMEPKNASLNRARFNNKKLRQAMGDAGYDTDELMITATDKNGRTYTKASDKLNKLRRDVYGEEFDLDFDDIDAAGTNLTEAKLKEDDENICCICGEEIEGYGNNPEPVQSEGRCCDLCNIKFVIPARLKALNNEK